MVCSLYHPLKRSWVFYPTSTLKYFLIYLGWAGSLLPHKPPLAVLSEGYSLVEVERGVLSSCGSWAPVCGVFSCCGAWTLEHWLSGCGAWAVLLHGMWELPGQGSNPSPLNCQVDSYPLDHQGSPAPYFFLF